MSAWIVFFLSAAIVIAAGSRLTRDGEVIAERTGLGDAWVGAILIAGMTSLPELVTGVSAAVQGNANLSMGDLFGSSMANMMILAVADLMNPRGYVLSRVTVNQVIVGALAITLTCIALAGASARPGMLASGLGWGPAIIAVVYVLGMRLLHVNRGQEPFLTEAEDRKEEAALPPLAPAVIGFTIGGILILLAAPRLAASAAEIAEQLGISKGFAGMALLAITTSLPEIVVSIAGIRRGLYDIVVGNLLGSNCFNMTILLPLDIADGRGSVLAAMEPAASIAAIFSLLMMAQVLMGILHRPQRRVWFLEPHAVFLAGTYAVGMLLAYRGGAG